MDTDEQLQALREEMGVLRGEMDELRAQQAHPHVYTTAEKRWLEVCRCFRDGKGKVSTYEADQYLEKRKGYCKDLVVAGIVTAREDDSRHGKRLFVDAGAIELAVRTGYL